MQPTLPDSLTYLTSSLISLTQLTPTILVTLCINPTQIYVEVPRARLTMELARIKESEGNITEAADVLQELQVK